jgi:hypothetical protein
VSITIKHIEQFLRNFEKKKLLINHNSKISPFFNIRFFVLHFKVREQTMSTARMSSPWLAFRPEERHTSLKKLSRYLNWIGINTKGTTCEL